MARIQQAVVSSYQQMAFDLLQSVEHDTHENQQGSTAEELGETLTDTEHASKSWKNSNNRDEQ